MAPQAKLLNCELCVKEKTARAKLYDMERWGIIDLKLIQIFLVASLFTGIWFAALSDYYFKILYLFSIKF